MEENNFSEHELRAAFKQVSRPQDWKAPIEAVIPLAKVPVTIEAVNFYTATSPLVSIDAKRGVAVVESPGYRLGPAGDH